MANGPSGNDVTLTIDWVCDEVRFTADIVVGQDYQLDGVQMMHGDFSFPTTMVHPLQYRYTSKEAAEGETWKAVATFSIENEAGGEILDDERDVPAQPKVARS